MRFVAPILVVVVGVDGSANIGHISRVERRLIAFNFNLDIHGLSPQPTTYSDDDIPHTSFVSLMVFPESHNGPTWGIPDILSRFKTASYAAWNRILPFSNIITVIRFCDFKHFSDECIQGYIIWALFISELSSRETRKGEEPYIAPTVEESRNLCLPFNNDRVIDWLRKDMRRVVREREAGGLDG
jgi:hypothetical protein